MSNLQRYPSAFVSSVKDKVVFLQRPVHLHLITTTVTEVTRYTLTAEGRQKTNWFTYWQTVCVLLAGSRNNPTLQEMFLDVSFYQEARLLGTDLYELSSLWSCSILTDMNQDPPHFIHAASSSSSSPEDKNRKNVWTGYCTIKYDADCCHFEHASTVPHWELETWL